MKSVAKNATVSSVTTSDTLIKSFQRSNTLPNDFVATTTNTISLTTSSVPIYIFFDDTNSAGIMYYYAENNADVVANSDSSNMFIFMNSLTDITGVSNWDTAKVTNMGGMFSGTKIASLESLVPNKNNNPNIWNTGNVTNMGSMFHSCSSLTDITGIASWDVSRVTATAGSAAFSANRFYGMFYGVPSATTSGFSFTNRAGSINSDGTYVTSN